MDVASEVPQLLRAHAAVRAATLIGSRADGSAHELSDWDFSVETDDYGAVRDELPRLLAPLAPVASQWDRYSDHATFMLILSGPVKIDLLFLDEPQEWAPPWKVGPDTLEAVDTHFWDWILWLEQKRRAGRDDVLAVSLRHLHERLLRPMGISEAPTTVRDAIGWYVAARGALECGFQVPVSRALEAVVRPVLPR